MINLRKITTLVAVAAATFTSINAFAYTDEELEQFFDISEKTKEQSKTLNSQTSYTKVDTAIESIRNSINALSAQQNEGTSQCRAELDKERTDRRKADTALYAKVLELLTMEKTAREQGDIHITERLAQDIENRLKADQTQENQ